MRRWIVVVAVLGLFLATMVASAAAQQVLVNYSKSANAPGPVTLGLVLGNPCQQIIKKLRENAFKQQPTAKFFVQGSQGAVEDALSYLFLGPSKATVLIDCAVPSS